MGDQGEKKLEEEIPWDENAARIFARIICKDIPAEDPRFLRTKKRAMAFLQGFEPRDGIERMMLTQLLLTHARMEGISRSAMTQKTMEHMEMFNTMADRAANTFRRTSEALKAYRKPTASRRRTYTSIRTAHITANQVISPKEIPAVEAARLPGKAVTAEVANEERTEN
jgi:hypothetical protein